MMSTTCPPTDTNRAWPVLLAAAAWRRRGTPVAMAWTWEESATGSVRELSLDDESAWLCCLSGDNWQTGEALPVDCRDLVELYLPLLSASAERPVAVGHLGQSVDACIATASGDSTVVTGADNFVHLHRMRALCDAIIIGGGTAAADDPQLTTRQVDGPNPVRVVVDPACALPASLQVFSDGAARTCLACDLDAQPGAQLDERDVIRLPRSGGRLCLATLRTELGKRGLHALFVEGGGITVTRWMQAELLTRLHVAIAPVLVGQGRAALQLPSAVRMRDALRPSHRLYRMGEDVFWDFDLTVYGRGAATEGSIPASGLQRLL